MKRDRGISCELVWCKQEGGTWIITPIPWTSQGPCRWQTSVGRPATSSTWSRWLGLEMPWQPWHDSCSSLVEVQLAVERSWLSFQSRLTCLINICFCFFDLNKSEHWTDPLIRRLHHFWMDWRIIHVASLNARGLVLKPHDRFWRCSGDSTFSSLHTTFVHFTIFYPMFHASYLILNRLNHPQSLWMSSVGQVGSLVSRCGGSETRCRCAPMPCHHRNSYRFIAIRTVLWCNAEEDVEGMLKFRWEADLGMPWHFELHLDRNVYTNYDKFFLKLLKLLKFWRLW